MHNNILSALDATYAFRGWSFNNEAEFKHELFHQLALTKYMGIPLSQVEPGARTPRLHAEGKVENGNPAKADLLICNPAVFQGFNYKVDHIIELKVSLKKSALNAEMRKLESYKKRTDGIWLVSLNPLEISDEDIPKEHRATDSLRVIGPKPTGDKNDPQEFRGESPTMSAALKIVSRCIDKCLNLYGNGKEQFQSYFWCNFEHELERGHSFPCEGDFNASLYHYLRRDLPSSLIIRSEYSPNSRSRRRIDFLIQEPSGKWAIPIEIKMNWDQFKPKYKFKPKSKDRIDVQSEALTILERFSAIKEEVMQMSPILVVIQGEWRRVTKIQNEKMQNKKNALNDLKTANFPVELVSFDESKNAISRKNYGR